MNEQIGKKIIIKGEMLHNVGFRPYLLLNALKLKIKRYEAENVGYDGKEVQVLLAGDARQISEFIDSIIKELPLEEKKVKVIEIMEEDLDLTTALNIVDIDEYRKRLNVEQLNNIVQGGLKLREDTNANFNRMNVETIKLREETNANFNRMDEKYEKMSQAIFGIIERFEKRDEMFEKRLEKTDKHIERLLEILEKRKTN